MFSVSTFACPHLSHVNEHSTVIPHGAFAEQPSTEIYEGTGALITEQLAAGNGKSEARSDRHTSSDALRVVRLPCGLSAWDPSRNQHECHVALITASLVDEGCCQCEEYHDHRSTPTSGRWWRSRSIDRVLVATIDLRRRAA